MSKDSGLIWNEKIARIAAIEGLGSLKAKEAVLIVNVLKDKSPLFRAKAV